MEQNMRVGDVVALYPPTYIYDFDYYYKGKSKVVGVPSLINLNTGEYTQTIIVRLSNVITAENKCNTLKILDENSTGVWLVQMKYMSDPDLLLRSCLDDNLNFVDSKESLQLSFRHYSVK